MPVSEERLVLGCEPWQRAASCYVRFNVFVLERRINMVDEFDHLDTPDRLYAVLYVGKEPVATGRFVRESGQTARLTRIATLAKYRGKHYGRQVIKALENHARQEGITTLYIHSELTAKTFYEELGYKPCSEVYEEDGELCQSLSKSLNEQKE